MHAQLFCIQVLKLSQFLLLQTAADDAIVRLQNSAFPEEEIVRLTSWYFRHQQHTSIGEFLHYNCNHQVHEVFMQVRIISLFISMCHIAKFISSGYYSLPTDDLSRVGDGD